MKKSENDEKVHEEMIEVRDGYDSIVIENRFITIE
jgi:hypothetical protein